MKISQSPIDFRHQLVPRGDFYICSSFNQEVVGPSVLEISERQYYRFMNYIYLPEKPEKLSTQQIIDLCDLRAEYLNNLLNEEFNRTVVSIAAFYIQRHFQDHAMPINALDFGCGTGLSTTWMSEQMPDLEIIGIDISERAIFLCRQQALNVTLVRPNQAFPFVEHFFDVAFAIFVMHFNIDAFFVGELRRILKPGGIFVFNIYKVNVEEIIGKLRQHNFKSFEVVDVKKGFQGSHKIIVCR